MNTRLRKLAVLALVALAAALLGAWFAGKRFAPQAPDSDAVRLLWSLELPRADGQPLALGSLRGRVLVVNFWATWCPPCVHEIPELSRIRDEYADKGVEIIGIGVDNADNIAKFVQRVQISYPLVVAGMEGAELSRLFGNTSGVLPFTVLLDRNGRIVEQRVGIVRFDRLRQQLEGLAAASPG